LPVKPAVDGATKKPLGPTPVTSTSFSAMAVPMGEAPCLMA